MYGRSKHEKKLFKKKKKPFIAMSIKYKFKTNLTKWLPFTCSQKNCFITRKYKWAVGGRSKPIPENP